MPERFSCSKSPGASGRSGGRSNRTSAVEPELIDVNRIWISDGMGVCPQSDLPRQVCRGVMARVRSGRTRPVWRQRASAHPGRVASLRQTPSSRPTGSSTPSRPSAARQPSSDIWGATPANLSGCLEPDAQLTRSVVVFPRAACLLAQKVEDGAGLRVCELHSRSRALDPPFDDDCDPDGGANRTEHVGHRDLVECDGDQRWESARGRRSARCHFDRRAVPRHKNAAATASASMDAPITPTCRRGRG